MNSTKRIYSVDIQNECVIKKGFTSTLLTCLEKQGLIFRKKEGKKKRIFISRLGQKAILGEVLTDDEIKLISTKKRIHSQKLE